MKFLHSMTFQVFYDLYEPCLKWNVILHPQIFRKAQRFGIEKKSSISDISHWMCKGNTFTEFFPYLNCPLLFKKKKIN